MVIQSSFKDYYDFVAHQYGGGDPSIVFVRGKITNIFVQTNCPLIDPNVYSLPGIFQKFQHAYLIILGKAYVLRRPRLSYKLSDFRIMPKDYGNDQVLKGNWLAGRRVNHWGMELRVESQFLIDLSIQVCQPIFVIGNVDAQGIHIYDRSPILECLGMASIVSPEQMYQQLSMFIGNTMRKPPATNPPVELGNKQKIVKAGFDLTQSFRHRK